MSFLKIILLSLIINSSAFSAENALYLDLTQQLEFLGNPYQSQYPKGEAIYARNVWDLQSYHGQLYIGAGNSSNKGPSPDAGPIELIKYDPLRDQFIPDISIEDEQINSFHVFNDQLFIPGYDATGSSKWGNFYHKKSQGQLTLYRNIPKAGHVYDLALIKGKLYSALSIKKGGAAIGETSDMGKNWEIKQLGEGEVYHFLIIGETVFAIKKLYKKSYPSYYAVIQRLNKSNFFLPRLDLETPNIFPQTSIKYRRSRVVRATNLGSSALYIGAYVHNKEQTKPFGLYMAMIKGGDLVTKRLNLEKNETPRDIIKKGNKVYILTSIKNKNMTTNNVLLLNQSNSDDIKLSKVFSFNYASFARSFEQIKGDFYFGIGSDINKSRRWKQKELLPETGDILRIKQNMY